MLQRIQTVYLIIIIVCLSITSFSDIGIYSFTENKTEISAIVNTQGVRFQLAVDGEVKDLSKEISELEKELKESPAMSYDNKTGLKILSTLDTLKKGIPMPLYIPFMLIICFNIWILISYKNLKRQLSFARINTFICLLLTAAIIIGFSLGTSIGKEMLNLEEITDQIEITTGMGLGFFTAIIAFPFALLAQISIKRDLKLIQSIDRIR